MVILFVVTGGLYRIYWLIVTRKELLKKVKKAKILSPLFLILPPLLMIVSLVVLMHSGNHDQLVCHRNNTINGTVLAPSPDCTTMPGFEPSAGAVALFYLACASLLPLLSIFFWGYSKAVSDLTKDRITFPVAFLLLVALPFGFDILIIQEAFNELKPGKAKATTA